MILRAALLLFVLPLPALCATGFGAEKLVEHGNEIVRLTDRHTDVVVSLRPSLGNRAYEIKVHGKNLLYAPKEMPFSGIPFLAPWANRLAGAGFWANGKRYALNGALGSARVDSSGIAIHGLITASPHWEVTEVRADRESARVTCRLAFWRYPELMANWPFAHEYEMTYRLTDSGLEVRTKVRNLSAEAFPIAIGFHPYFQLPGSSRADETIHVPARKHVETDSQLVAPGALTSFESGDGISLEHRTFDDGFTDLVRDEKGQATFSVEAGSRKIEVVYGPRYQVAVVYAPPKQQYVCFEPMTAITNGINLAHDGKYGALESVAPGATWQESFWIRFRGF